MTRFVRAASAAAIAVGGIGAVGCVGTGSNRPGLGACYNDHVDPCWPERYASAARNATLAPFAAQVNNGNVINQTVWNWYFEPGTDKLTPAGRAKLDSLAQVRPAPDSRLYLQAARDVLVTAANIDGVGAAREDLTAKRAAAVQRYMATQPVIGAPMAYEIYVHDPVVAGIPAEFSAGAFRGQGQGYRGGIGGASGTSATSTGGGGQTPAASSIGTGGTSTGSGGTTGGGGGGPSGSGGGTGNP